ncbi:hypothetical protein [Sulfoacidibacillus ferrooxidans]|uniref:Uncharacterized protein n=1 Tax=Sulfoacidibacillus ferrooxidans TaxID=2005001 RepID=A0A9X2AFK7_9BACL|nr:hypothetical protein [Sulfoacidibacillus ferrooxidans]MCI0184572.1 hypothetical protein [Sulfoacidibacillus ferrooxidans]
MMQPSYTSSSNHTQLDEVMIRNYDQTQEDMRELRAALRKLSSKIDQQQLTVVPNNQEQIIFRTVTPQEKVMMIRYVRENIEKFNEVTDRLNDLHQELQGWKEFRSELQEVKEQLHHWKTTQLANTETVGSQQIQTVVP